MCAYVCARARIQIKKRLAIRGEDRGRNSSWIQIKWPKAFVTESARLGSVLLGNGGAETFRDPTCTTKCIQAVWDWCLFWLLNIHWEECLCSFLLNCIVQRLESQFSSNYCRRSLQLNDCGMTPTLFSPVVMLLGEVEEYMFDSESPQHILCFPNIALQWLYLSHIFKLWKIRLLCSFIISFPIGRTCTSAFAQDAGLASIFWGHRR